MKELAMSGDLDAIQPKRAEILENWRKRAIKEKDRSYQLASGKADVPKIVVTRETIWSHGSEDSWVHVEQYITGRIVHLGGKTKAAIHIETPEGTTRIISAREEDLADEPKNHLYRMATLRVSAEKHLKTEALRNERLIGFVTKSNEIDEEKLQRLWANGRRAWKDVGDSVAWVEEQRGSLG